VTFESETAAIRFGTGLSPDIVPPPNVDEMLDRLAGPDQMAARFPIDGFARVEAVIEQTRRLSRAGRENPDIMNETKDHIRNLRKQVRLWQGDWLRASIARSVYTEDGLRERLTRFWADHFTVEGKRALTRTAVSTYVEDAIRPNITGRFADLLKAALFHPMMLLYLDQVNSVGPNSIAAARKPGRGLNENLAREVLELHTLGVNGAYTQTDVYELAKLFAGLTYRRGKGFVYGANMAEPGPETVLGKSYGGRFQDLLHVTDFLEDLAVNPDTARHLARKLVVHFVDDAPDAGQVEDVAAAYLASGGDLMATYRALLEHPAAWNMSAKKVKQPIDFITSSFRALGGEKTDITGLGWKHIRNLVMAPLGLMGQPWENPVGPDGWPEEAERWITPQGLAARIQWAMTVPAIICAEMPDPRRFIDIALGARAGEQLRFAAAGAESKSDGVGLILASPEFQRT